MSDPPKITTEALEAQRQHDRESGLGLYHKFKVTRTNGSSAPGERHENCEYFVLDCTHDPHAKEALRAYAASCTKDYPQLAIDIYELIDRSRFSRDWKP